MKSHDPWVNRPDSHAGCSLPPTDTRIPFRASSLPLLARPRIRSPNPPSTPKKSKPIFTPRSILLTPSRKRCSTPAPESNQFLTPPPTPTPFSSFSQTPTTPGLSSTCSTSPTRSSRLVTPITPTHIRYDDRGMPRYDSGYQVRSSSPETPMNVFRPWLDNGGLEDQETLRRKIPPTPKSMTKTPWDMVYPPQQVEEVLIDPIRAHPKMLHHVSSDGGSLAALKRYIVTSKDEKSISGMSLFLHCPKKRVPLHSIERIRKERKLALEWSQLLKVSGEYIVVFVVLG
jgi:hypothetical protein